MARLAGQMQWGVLILIQGGRLVHPGSWTMKKKQESPTHQGSRFSNWGVFVLRKELGFVLVLLLCLTSFPFSKNGFNGFVACMVADI